MCNASHCCSFSFTSLVKFFSSSGFLLASHPAFESTQSAQATPRHSFSGLLEVQYLGAHLASIKVLEDGHTYGPHPVEITVKTQPTDLQTYRILENHFNICSPSVCLILIMSEPAACVC